MITRTECLSIRQRTSNANFALTAEQLGGEHAEAALAPRAFSLPLDGTPLSLNI